MRGRVDFSFAIGLLRRNAALLAFPIISMVVVGIVSVLLLAPFGLQLINDAAAGAESAQLGPVTIALFIVCFIVDAAVVAFFNGALMSEALVVVRGGHASVGNGVAVAARRAPQILAWGLVTATVGAILSALQNKGGIGGALLSIIGGLAWGVATLFVLPVVIVEGLYPVGAIKRSVAILRDLFGPGAALGSFRRAWGFGVGYLVVVIGGILLAIVLIFLGFLSANVVVAVPAVIAGILIFGLVAIVASALGAMVSAVLYVYAVDKTTPPDVDPVLLRSGLVAR
ncbi:MAG: DUF6159 family protein [Chloroflexota bacterium]